MQNSKHLMLRFLTTHLVVTAITLLIAARTFAQQAVTAPPSTAPTTERVDAQGNPLPAAGEGTTERIFVTGSIIPSAGEVGPNPVLHADRALIDKTGERTTEELLRNLPISNANGIPVSNNENGSNTTVGAATIALRGFDARATLILLDGRRVAPYPTGNVGVVFVDLNSIAAASIESIEILKDGASTTYGADAVAGVVNVKRYHDYHGAEARVEYGNTTDKDSGSFSASLLFGVGNGQTNVSGTINYYHRNSIFNRDRDFSAVPPFLSSNASPYNLQLTNAAVAAAGGMVIPSMSGTQFATPPDFTNGLAPANMYLYGAGRVRAGANGFNFNQFSLSYPSSERYGGYVAMDHKFFGDAVVIYGDAMYQNVKTHNELAAPATGSFQTPGQITIAIPPRTPQPTGITPFGGPTYAETGLTPGAFNPFNPFEQIISGGSRARLAEFGNRLFDNETDAFLATFGVRGDKLFNGTWGYDFGGRYSQVKNTTTGTQVSASRFNRILNQADPIFDPTSSQYIGTTVAFNPFGDYRSVPIASNAGSIAFARIHPVDRDETKLGTIDGTIYTTDLFDLPAGGVGFAFGGQFRRETLDENPDQLNVLGDVAGNSAILPAHGGRKSYAFYAETSIPIFSRQNAIPGFYALDLTAAGRFEDFENNNTNVLVPKIGLRWQPIDEQLTLRATWGKGFREPSLEELYTQGVFDIRASHDPMNGGAFEPETQTLIIGNTNLAPEDSESISFGFVYSPKYVPGLTISTDFWQIDRTGVVDVATDDAVLQRELTGTLRPGEVVQRFPDGTIARIIVPYTNEAEQKANGIDFGIQYVKETEWGTFTSLTQGTYLNSFERSRGSGEPLDQLAGQSTNLGASNEGYYRWRGNSSLDWTWKGFDFVTTVRYIDGFHEENANLDRHDVGHKWFFDLQASYDFSALVHRNTAVAGKDYSKGSNKGGPTALETTEMSIWDHLLYGTTFTVGVINLFDNDPPFASGQGGNAVGYPGFTYDATGRFYYVRLTKKF
ncbi:MAG: TonB-dependent receptor plug domain-containing protein [Chthoniobacterales bacterium]